MRPWALALRGHIDRRVRRSLLLYLFSKKMQPPPQKRMTKRTRARLASKFTVRNPGAETQTAESLSATSGASEPHAAHPRERFTRPSTA